MKFQSLFLGLFIKLNIHGVPFIQFYTTKHLFTDRDLVKALAVCFVALDALF
jgi:hypothetical protein